MCRSSQLRIVASQRETCLLDVPREPPGLCGTGHAQSAFVRSARPIATGLRSLLGQLKSEVPAVRATELHRPGVTTENHVARRIDQDRSHSTTLVDSPLPLPGSPRELRDGSSGAATGIV